jgi:hypothetical protein
VCFPLVLLQGLTAFRLRIMSFDSGISRQAQARGTRLQKVMERATRVVLEHDAVIASAAMAE